MAVGQSQWPWDRVSGSGRDSNEENAYKTTSVN